MRGDLQPGRNSKLGGGEEVLISHKPAVTSTASMIAGLEGIVTYILKIYLPTYLPIYLPTYLSTYLRTYVRTYVQSYNVTQSYSHTCIYILSLAGPIFTWPS